MIRNTLLVASACLAGAVAAFAADAAQEIAEKRAALAARSPAATPAEAAAQHYELGLFARARGAEDDARAEFKAAVAADPAHAAAHAALGHVRAGDAWLGFDEAMAAKGLVQRGGAWILREEAAILDLPAAEKARRAEQEASVGRLLKAYGAQSGAGRKFAEEALAGVDDRYKLAPCAWALRGKSADVRTFAAKELGRLGDRRGLRPLLWRALHDPEASVREASVASAKSIGDANLVAPFAAAMWSDNAQVRMNAVEGARLLRDPVAVKYLVYRFEAHGGGAPRCYYTNVKQVSFIQDFDVEVAQTAFIADPNVGTIQEGFVVDVQVVATSAVGVMVEREAVHLALRDLTGATDVKNEPGAWARWWTSHQREFETAAK